MNLKKLVIVLPVVWVLLLLFSKQVTDIEHDTTIHVYSSQRLIPSGDYHSPHPGTIQAAIEIYSQVTRSPYELKKNQWGTLSSSIHSNLNTYSGDALKRYNHVVPSIAFYISYCTIVV